MSELSARDRQIFEAFMNAVLALLLVLVRVRMSERDYKILEENTQAIMVDADKWKDEE